MTSSRTKLKIEKDLLRRVNHIVLHEIRDPRVQEGLLCITETRISPDYSILKCYVTVQDKKPAQVAVIDALNRASGFIRRRLGEHLVMRTTPQVRFYLDDTPERAQRIDEILVDVKDQTPAAGVAPDPDPTPDPVPEEAESGDEDGVK